jgi:hypothetical protein
MNKNYIFIRLELLTLSPIFPSLLSFLLFTAYKIYFDPFMLCDEGDWYKLYELKGNLTREIANYNITMIKIGEYSDLQTQLNEVSRPNYRNFSQESFYSSKLDTWQKRSINSLNNIRQIECSIRMIDPNFKSSVAHFPFSNFGRR